MYNKIELQHGKSPSNNLLNPRFVLQNCNEIVLTKSSDFFGCLTCHFCIDDAKYAVYNKDYNAQEVLDEIEAVFL